MAIISVLLQIFGLLGIVVAYKEERMEMKYAILIQAILFWSLGYMIWIAF